MRSLNFRTDDACMKTNSERVKRGMGLLFGTGLYLGYTALREKRNLWCYIGISGAWSRLCLFIYLRQIKRRWAWRVGRDESRIPDKSRIEYLRLHRNDGNGDVGGKDSKGNLFTENC